MAIDDSASPSPLSVSSYRYPTGWFQIGWSDELAAGALSHVHYFGQDIALWRGKSGALHATDAYCLHLGANLAVGGRVVGEEIACPFHGWQWDGEGRNTRIPHSELACKPNLRLKVWDVRDWCDAIIAWHDWADGPPQWEPELIPELNDGSYLPIGKDARLCERIKAHPQMVLENGPDLFHVAFVHGGNSGRIVKYEFDGHVINEDLALTYGEGRPSTWLTPNGPIEVTLQSRAWGIGQSIIRWPDEMGGAISFTQVTPVDDTFTDYFSGMAIRRRDDNVSGLGERDKRFLSHQLEVVRQDFPIWEHMKYSSLPNFAPEEAKNYSALGPEILSSCRNGANRLAGERCRGSRGTLRCERANGNIPSWTGTCMDR